MDFVPYLRISLLYLSNHHCCLQPKIREDESLRMNQKRKRHGSSETAPRAFSFSRSINPLSGLERLNEAVKRSNKLFLHSKKSALQSKSMKRHQLLHLNDTADYKLGSLGFQRWSGVVYVDTLLIVLPLVSAVNRVHCLHSAVLARWLHVQA